MALTRMVSYCISGPYLLKQKESEYMVHKATTENITVQLENVSFYDADSSFTIAGATTSDNIPITIVGFLKGGIPGEIIEARGSWRHEVKTVPKFYAETFTKTLPLTEKGILKFLHSGVINGLDPRITKEITSRFGSKTFEILHNDSHKLADIPGMTDDKRCKITASWQKHLKILELTDFLHSVAISPSFAAPIYKHFGNEALATIKANPYKMVHKISGFSFIAATKIAKQLNLDLPPDQYVKYGLFSMLESKVCKGHMYYPYSKLVSSSVKKLGLKPELVINAIAQSAAEGQLTLVDLNASPNFIINNKAVYFTQDYDHEQELCQRLNHHLQTPINPKFTAALNICKQLPGIDEIERNHVRYMLACKLCIVDDFVKRNKRAIMQSMATLGEYAGLKVLLATYNKTASTRANIKQAPVQQLDELLDVDCATGEPRYNAQNQLDCDILAVTQASLINSGMLLHIMRALPEKATLVLSGDSNHLPPAGPGCVFYDLPTSGKIPVRKLGDMANTGCGSLSYTAELFSRGEMPPLPEFMPFERKEMLFYFIEQETPQKIMKTISGLVPKRLPHSRGYNQLDIQVISLAEKGPVGSKKLNIYLQNRLNKRTGGLKHNGFIYKINDKITQMRDDYTKGLLAGQTALITDVNMYKKELYAQTGHGQKITYIFHELNDIRPAYAMPANKTMGHKFKAVIVPIHCDSYFNLDRTSLYSTMLAAGEMLIIVGQTRAFKIALGNYIFQKRYTRLKNLLLSDPS